MRLIMETKELGVKEQRIREITHMYYSRLEIQRVIFEFSKNREICPRYFEGFGKRPDSFQYLGDIFSLVKKGATSFNCSEELWEDPLKLSTDLNEKQIKELRQGWDLLFDVDSKYIDYSKISAELIIEVLRFHGIKNVGVKFSGSKGFHIIVPWKAFPKEINGVNTSDMFPEWPRIILKYINEQIKEQLVKRISGLFYSNQYVKDFKASEQVMPDMILVSPRHLFRMPYSLHEKTALASIVIPSEKIKDFELKDANPLKIEIRNFMPDSREGEARELLVQALDWHKENFKEEEQKKNFDFKPIVVKDFSTTSFPPSIQQILKGVKDGRKRALFILLNFFRSIGMEKEELEKRLSDWNKLNEIPLHNGYVKAQLLWAYRNKITPPPNYDKDYYKGIGIIPTPEEMKFKNPVNFMAKKIKNS